MVAAESRIGLCIAGCGSIAKAHAEVARRRDARIRLYFASRSQAKAVRYANRYGAEGAFGSYEAAAKDPRVDAILFCTPHSLHRPNLELAATHKKHVLMEKPIATTIEDADAMTDTALKAGIHLMVAENFRYMPAVRACVDLISQGTIGSLQSVHLQATKYQRSRGWRLSRNMMGGGALIDGGIHEVSVMRMLCGDPLRISAVMAPKIFPEMEGEEAISLWASFANGTIGTLTYSWAVQGDPGHQSFLAIGTKGPTYFNFYERELTVRSIRGERTISLEGDESGFGTMLDAFLDLISCGLPVQTASAEATGDLAFVLRAYASAEAQGQPM